jgi:outer membrane protein TolC
MTSRRSDVSKKRIVIVILALASLALRPAAAQDRQVLNLGLEDCIAKALRNNLAVAVEKLNPDLADIQVSKARELFLPQFDITYGSNRTANPSYWFLQGSGTSVSNLASYGVSIVENVPTGGNFSVSLQNYRSETNQAFQLINPRYGSTLQFSLVQPLLKNFGPKVARRGITLAETNLDVSQLQLRNTMQETVFLVQQTYWNYFFAVENYKVKQQSLQLARELLDKNRKEVEFGQLAPIDVLTAESVVAQRDADLIQAEGVISRSEEVLKSIINLAAEGDARKLKVLPSDKPAYAETRVSLDEAMKEALERRPDLRILKKGMEIKELNLSVAKNQTLPSLDLQVAYSSPGISGDLLLYQNNDPFLGVIIGKQKGSPSGALNDAFKFLYNNWNIGLTLSVPLSSLLTKADLTYAKMDLSQSQVRIKSQEQQIELEVSDALRTIETNAKRVGALRISRELAERTLEAEQKKLQVGLSTNYFVLDFQEKLANARSAELRAQIEYILAVASLEKAMGVNLEKRGFKIVQ